MTSSLNTFIKVGLDSGGDLLVIALIIKLSTLSWQYYQKPIII